MTNACCLITAAGQPELRFVMVQMMLLGLAELRLHDFPLKQQALGLAAAYESRPREQVVKQFLHSQARRTI